MSISPKLTIHFILRSDAQHRVSKVGPESIGRSAHTGAPFEAASGLLRARGTGLFTTKELL
jgi:hypothetical protein